MSNQACNPEKPCRLQLHCSEHLLPGSPLHPNQVDSEGECIKGIQ